MEIMGSEKRLQELEDKNLALQMPNMELITLVEKVEEEKRHMFFVMQKVLDEKIVKRYTHVEVKETSKHKQVCDNGSNGDVSYDF